MAKLCGMPSIDLRNISKDGDYSIERTPDFAGVALEV
jgi:hypothetical protein